MIMCIGGKNDGSLISYIEPFIYIPVLEQSTSKAPNFDPRPPSLPSVLKEERYRLEKFTWNGETKYAYVFSNITNEQAAEEIPKRWHQMDLT